MGFVARPIGAVLFGHLGDSHGRRVALLLSILCISVPTILIGALPTYAQAGVVAPVLLALLRLVQGLAVGGEVSRSGISVNSASFCMLRQSLCIFRMLLLLLMPPTQTINPKTQHHSLLRVPPTCRHILCPLVTVWHGHRLLA